MKVKDWDGFMFFVEGCPECGEPPAYIFARTYAAAEVAWIERCNRNSTTGGGCGCDYQPRSISIAASLVEIDFDHELRHLIGQGFNALMEREVAAPSSNGKAPKPSVRPKAVVPDDEACDCARCAPEPVDTVIPMAEPDEITPDHLADMYARTVEETRSGARELLKGMAKLAKGSEAKTLLGNAIDLLA